MQFWQKRCGSDALMSNQTALQGNHPQFGTVKAVKAVRKKHSTFVATRHASPLCHSRSLAGATPSGTKEECQMFCMLHSHMCKNPNIPAYMFLNVCSCCNVTLLLASGNDCAVRRNN